MAKLEISKGFSGFIGKLISGIFFEDTGRQREKVLLHLIGYGGTRSVLLLFLTFCAKKFMNKTL